MLGSTTYCRLSGLIRRASVAVLGAAGDTVGRHAEAASDVVRNVRGYDFSRHSDSDLRAAVGRLRTLSDSTGGDGIRNEIFALVDEAIRRRLGAWRLFDLEFEHASLVEYRRHASCLMDAGDYRSQVAYYADDSFFESKNFYNSLESYLTQSSLQEYEKTVVAAMVRVSEETGLRYRSEIMLPAGFYSALFASPAAGALRFCATDQQITAAYQLCEGRVVEMHAGEGKTIAAMFAAVSHALLGRKVHVVTSNDYLASRDAEWLVPVYASLGLEVRTILGHMSDPERRHAYEGDVIYGPLRELGFDFLRDNLRYSEEEVLQGPLEVAIVDEADQTLIDESRLPLIISGGAESSTKAVRRIRRAVEKLVHEQALVVRELLESLDRDGVPRDKRRDILAKVLVADPQNSVLIDWSSRDPNLFRSVWQTAYGDNDGLGEEIVAEGLYYTVGQRQDSIATTEKGEDLLERHLGCIFSTQELELQVEQADSSYHLPLPERRRIRDRLMRRLSRQYNQMNLVFQLLRAFILLERDVDYVVSDGGIVLIDKLTGRTRPDNRYHHGLHAALEAKEDLQVKPEGQTLAEISVQGFIKQYAHISGMTGTALASSDEFRRAYGLEVVIVPDAQPSQRTDQPTRLYPTTEDKLQAIVRQVLFWHGVGRPMLIGAVTVRQADEISQLLSVAGVQHRHLDAVNSSDEATIVKLAGGFGAVTVATNIAGRGTDIVLDPLLNDRILRRYVRLIEELLSGGKGSVEIVCPTEGEARILESAVEEKSGLTAKCGVGSEVVCVTATKEAVTWRGETAHLEFGLGILVIGTEMNESLRTDFQLRGRSGRQGDFGGSKFMLSLQDRNLFPGRLHSFHNLPLDSHQDGQFSFLEGARTDKHLRAVQGATELDDEMIRSLTWDYSHAIEWQSMSYYRARRKLMAKESFQAEYLRFMRQRASRLVDQYMPLAMIGDYAVQFDRLSEEAALDYGVDCEPMWGLGAEMFKRNLARAMIRRLREQREYFDETRFDKIAKLLFLQTADELWAEHLSRLSDLMLSVRLGAHEHRTAVAKYVFLSSEEGGKFTGQVIDNFLPRLMNFAARRSRPVTDTKPNLRYELQEILI